MCDTHSTLHELHVVAAESLGRRIREPGAVFGALFFDGIHLRYGHCVRPRISAPQVGAQCKLTRIQSKLVEGSYFPDTFRIKKRRSSSSSARFARDTRRRDLITAESADVA